MLEQEAKEREAQSQALLAALYALVRRGERAGAGDTDSQGLLRSRRSVYSMESRCWLAKTVATLVGNKRSAILSTLNPNLERFQTRCSTKLKTT